MRTLQIKGNALDNLPKESIGQTIHCDDLDSGETTTLRGKALCNGRGGAHISIEDRINPIGSYRATLNDDTLLGFLNYKEKNEKSGTWESSTTSESNEKEYNKYNDYDFTEFLGEWLNPLSKRYMIPISSYFRYIADLTEIFEGKSFFGFIFSTIPFFLAVLLVLIYAPIRLVLKIIVGLSIGIWAFIIKFVICILISILIIAVSLLYMPLKVLIFLLTFGKYNYFEERFLERLISLWKWYGLDS